MTVGGLYSASAKCGQAILRDELALASQVFVSSAPLGGPERLQVLRGLSAGPCSSILGRGEASCRQNVGSQAADLADVCARRAAVYQALTYGFSEPTAGYVEALQSGKLVLFLHDAVAWLGADAALYDPALRSLTQAAASLAAAGLDAAVRDTRVEHARLFTGPGRPAVMCYASQYLDADERGPGRLNGAAAAFAAAAYEANGVAPATARRELADHATTELEFLFHLCRREEDAWAAGERDEALRLRRTLDRFLREHAGHWLPELATAVHAAAARPPYSGMADLLIVHLAVELGEDVVGDARRPAR